MNSTTKTFSQYSVSVIVPIHNCQNTLKSTLDSLTSQTLKKIEIICIDDGSTDHSYDILLDYSKKYSNIKIFKTKNNGSFITRSKGISLAQGEYIGFCDADDIAEAPMYEKLYNAARNSNAELAVCAYYRKKNSDILSVEMTRPQEPYNIDHDSGWLVSINTSVWNKLIRSDIAKKHFSLKSNPRISEDALFLLSIYPNIKKICFISKPLYCYCISNSNAMKYISTEDIATIIDNWKYERTKFIQKSQENFLDIYDLAAFIHLGISIPLVMIKSNNKEFKTCISLLNYVLDSAFPRYKKSRFLSLKYVLKNREFMLLPFCAYLAKKFHLLIPLLKLYNYLTKKLNIDIKW